MTTLLQSRLLCHKFKIGAYHYHPLIKIWFPGCNYCVKYDIIFQANAFKYWKVLRLKFFYEGYSGSLQNFCVNLVFTILSYLSHRKKPLTSEILLSIPPLLSISIGGFLYNEWFCDSRLGRVNIYTMVQRVGNKITLWGCLR